MNQVPAHQTLPVGHLIATLNNVTNSYKFYWFLSILEYIQQNNSANSAIDTKIILTKMVAFVWYPINYYHLSFGKLDQLGNVVADLKKLNELSETSKFSEVEKYIHEHIFKGKNDQLSGIKGILNLARYVPFRFLSPWFADELGKVPDHQKDKSIVNLANQYFHSGDKRPLYKFSDDLSEISIHPEWFQYLKENNKLIKDFVLWQLLKYLQKNNPTIPNISEKIFEPQKRDLRLALDFWQFAFKKENAITCIYSNQQLSLNDLSIDHFLPWSYTCHDLLWNLVPTSREVNSSKSNNLPDFETYFGKFSNIQYQALQNIAHLQIENGLKDKFFEDYIFLFKLSSAEELSGFTPENFFTLLKEILAPQFSIAQSMGFQKNWRFRNH